MEIVEMIKVLATASLIDPRIGRKDDAERDMMAKAWLGVVGDVPFDFAIECVKKHYQTSSETFMQVHIVAKWKIERDRQREKEQLKQLTSDSQAVPMPDNVRALIRDWGKTKP